MSSLLQVVAEATGKPLAELEEVEKAYPFKLSSFLARRVQEGSYSTAALRQYLPDYRELLDVDGFVADPTGEGDLHPERSVLRTYDNRLALILTHQCLVYCRFCFRKDFVGFAENRIAEEDWDRAVRYLEAHPEVEDILLSGGDPLAVPNRRLLPILERLVAIPHLKTIRIHSRALSVFPDRIDDDLLRFFKANDHFWYYAHMNHPDDMDHPEVRAGVARLLSAGVPVLNQTVILKDVNDDPATLCRLMKLCYQAKVLAYNLYLLDRVKGAAHFEVPAERIAEIAASLARLPGPAQPVLVFVDAASRKHRFIFDDSLDILSFLRAR